MLVLVSVVFLILIFLPMIVLLIFLGKLWILFLSVVVALVIAAGG